MGALCDGWKVSYREQGCIMKHTTQGYVNGEWRGASERNMRCGEQTEGRK